MSARHQARAALLAVVVLAGGALAACGGTSSATQGHPGTAPASSATVDTRKIPGYGTVLVTSSGRVLYLRTPDASGGSACTGSCASVWSPLTVHGTPRAGPGADASLLSTYARGSGGNGVLYNKHALYTYTVDTGPGMVAGQGIKSHGGTWYLVSPAGKAITSTANGGY